MVVPVDRASFKEYCLDNKYSRWYFSIIDKAIDRCWNKDNAPCYIEGHHFIPRSLGGNDDTIVFLTAREHFICHVLLTKILISEDKAKMCLALYRLLNGNQKNYCKSSILYEKIKIEHSIACSLRSVKYWSQFTKEQRSSMRNGIKNGRFGKYIVWGKDGIHRKSIEKTHLQNKNIASISLDELVRFIENNSTPENSSDTVESLEGTIRVINDDVSIRSGKYGNYIFYKTPKMKKPKFISLKNFNKNIYTCSEIELIALIK